MSRRRWLSLVLVAAVGGVLAFLPARPMIADNRPLPADLALVPPDAIAFAHVRAADVWKHPELKPWRAVFEQAGQKNIALLDEHFAPKPSTTDRVTFVVLPAGKAKGPARRSDFGPFNPTLILHFNAPFDKELVKKAHAEKSKTKAVAGKEVVLAERTEVAMAFVDDRTLILGDEAGVMAILENTKKDGPLTPLLQSAAGGKPIFAGVNVKALPIPPDALAAIPDEFKPLTDLETVAAAIDLAKEPVLSVRLAFPNADSAKTGEKALRKLSDLGRVMLNQQREMLTAFLTDKLTDSKKQNAPALRPLGQLPEAALMVAGLGGLNFVDDVMAHPPIEREGAEIVATVKLPGWTAQFIGDGGGGRRPVHARRAKGSRSGREREGVEQPQTDRHRHARLPRRERPPPAGRGRQQEGEETLLLAGRDPAVPGTKRRLPTVQTRRGVGQ